MAYLIYTQYAVYYIFNAYLLVLVARALLSWVRVFNPYWRPEHPVAVFFLKLIYLLTEPPLAILGKYVKPIQLGNMGLDLSFIILFLLVMVLQNLVITGIGVLAVSSY